jgi:hypothetical protein
VPTGTVLVELPLLAWLSRSESAFRVDDLLELRHLFDRQKQAGKETQDV